MKEKEESMKKMELMNELTPLERLTQWHGEVEDTWYNEIEEYQSFLNPYYAVVELEKGKRYPLPFFFESRTWELLGCLKDTPEGKFRELKNRFPPWVHEWVGKWSSPNKGEICSDIYHHKNEKGEKFAIKILPFKKAETGVNPGRTGIALNRA
jgi:hypothetical protein